jgi:hypothetical protein
MQHMTVSLRAQVKPQRCRSFAPLLRREIRFSNTEKQNHLLLAQPKDPSTPEIMDPSYLPFVAFDEHDVS